MKTPSRWPFFSHFDSLRPEKHIQRVLHEVSTWSKLRHRNIVTVFGITTTFDYTISLITEWADLGSAIDYVQNRVVDPRPLVSGIYSQNACYLMCISPDY